MQWQTQVLLNVGIDEEVVSINLSIISLKQIALDLVKKCFTLRI